VSGNVSLYNETNGRAILPTPTIGGVGLLEDVGQASSIGFKAPGEVVLLLGEIQGWLGQSLYLRELSGREEGAPPPVDLEMERRVGDFVRGLIRDRIATAVHDVSDGGLLIALAEMAMATGVGVKLYGAPVTAAPHAFWFGEDQGRYVVTVMSDQAEPLIARARAIGVTVRRLGQTGGDSLTLAGERPILVKILAERFESWLPAYMAGQAH
jgi:phosphoribosylformylglycinamidine (FGAM) synthase-like enzyme